jgi:hypothetical protein
MFRPSCFNFVPVIGHEDQPIREASNLVYDALYLDDLGTG